MPTAWRLVKARHAGSAFDGEGARLFGGRWNSQGTAVVHASETRSLAVLEILVGIRSTRAIESYVLIPLEFDDSIVRAADLDRLPDDWRASPPPSSTQQIGDNLGQRQTSAVLRVPSVIIPAEFNYIINPAHPAFNQIKIGQVQEVTIDPRLLK